MHETEFYFPFSDHFHTSVSLIAKSKHVCFARFLGRFILVIARYYETVANLHILPMHNLKQMCWIAHDLRSIQESAPQCCNPHIDARQRVHIFIECVNVV